MLALLSVIPAALLLHAAPQVPTTPDSIARDSIARARQIQEARDAIRDAMRDGSLERSRREGGRARRDDRGERSRDGDRGTNPFARKYVELTPELTANAFRDARARGILDRARAARWEQDSTLTAYDAIARQRISAGLNFKAIGRDRLLFRSENAARVRWSRGRGAVVDVLGTRTAVPMAFPGAKVLAGVAEMTPIPYYPGREGLMWFLNFGDDNNDDGDDVAFVHPLDRGAEAYYQYSTGDSSVFHFADGKELKLVEVNVRAREPQFNLIVGSLWFDAGSGQLVRAAFRPSAPFNVWDFVKKTEPDDYEDIPKAVRPLISPMVFEIESFTVEYALHQGRWWLPRLQTASAKMQMGFMRAPATLQETFRYSSVNGTDTIPPIARGSRTAWRDSDLGDDMGEVIQGAIAGAVPGVQQSRRRFRSGPRCAQGDTLTHSQRRAGGDLRIAIRVPCDTAALAHSKELPPSIFDAGEEMFDTKEAESLTKELDLSLQPLTQGGQLPTLHYGLERGLLRYNRVEGLSAGLEGEQLLGRGYLGNARVRLGTADWQPNAELTVSRSDGRRTFALGAYHRLDVANDWGDPLGVGPSVSALLFGRDEGSYYRAWGAELTGTHDRGAHLTWRLFGERQRGASLETQMSLAHVINGLEFADNIRAAKATAAGAEVRARSAFGLDPHGFRLATDLRLEGATGTFDYGRGALDATFSHGLGSHLDASLTAGAGSTAGDVPAQRLWYLGGTQTVRGQRPGAAAGNSYWMARTEVGASSLSFRPVVFFDLGWAGSRDAWQHPGRPLSGAGFGASLMDGLIRFDVAKGIRPEKGWRSDFYLEATF
ncbi:MAG: ShlB/FhaC/HecB family hemolysin secretion/activation protein [Gemmatimonadaceae bacterium]